MRINFIILNLEVLICEKKNLGCIEIFGFEVVGFVFIIKKIC